MDGSHFWTAFLGFLAGVVFIGSIAARGRERKPPKLAGTAVPELGAGFDIAKRYDIVYCGDYGSAFVERLPCVLMVGYVGRDDESVSKGYMRGRWLVAEYRDGRRAYLLPQSILSFQESASDA